MYKWKIELILKSGKELTVYYKNDINNSLLIANEMLISNQNGMFSFMDKDETKHIFVKRSEIASAAISVA